VLTNVVNLFRQGALAASFEKRVLKNTSQLVDDRVNELVDWMSGKTQSQAESSLDYVHQWLSSREIAGSAMVGSVDRTFESGRHQLVSTLQREARCAAVYPSWHVARSPITSACHCLDAGMLWRRMTEAATLLAWPRQFRPLSSRRWPLKSERSVWVDSWLWRWWIGPAC
jgi:hypothetical protein